MSKNSPTVSIKNLTHSYSHPQTGQKVYALSGISLDIKKGEFVSIVGPSGCGKSTLLACLDGLLKVDSGDIMYNGYGVSVSRKKTSMVFQSHSLLPWRHVLDNITYGLELRGVSQKSRYKIGRDLVRLVGLSGFEAFYPHQLSGGMQQRVNLARALATDPEVLLLDEPFANLDAQTREFMQEELLKIWQKKKKTAIFVTHQINEAIYLADRVVVMTARPGTIKKMLDIPLPRPRDLRVKMSGRFKKLEKLVWDLIIEEVKKTRLRVEKGALRE